MKKIPNFGNSGNSAKIKKKIKQKRESKRKKEVVLLLFYRVRKGKGNRKSGKKTKTKNKKKEKEEREKKKALPSHHWGDKKTKGELVSNRLDLFSCAVRGCTETSLQELKPKLRKPSKGRLLRRSPGVRF